MFIYNITIKVDNEIVPQWLQWQREVNISEIIATNLFNYNKIFKLLDNNDVESSTYVLQILPIQKKIMTGISMNMLPR